MELLYVLDGGKGQDRTIPFVGDAAFHRNSLTTCSHYCNNCHSSCCLP